MMIVKYFILLISVLIILGMLFFFYILPDKFDPLGGGSESCITKQLPTIASSAGMVVSGQQTLCDDVVHDSAIYVHVHKSGEVESRRSLVFRYADYPSVDPPEIKWNNDSTLLISVGNVSQVTKMITFIDGVKIVYTVGNEEYPREAWQNHINNLKLFSVFVFVLMLGLTNVCKNILSSISR